MFLVAKCREVFAIHDRFDLIAHFVDERERRARAGAERQSDTLPVIGNERDRCAQLAAGDAEPCQVVVERLPGNDDAVQHGRAAEGGRSHTEQSEYKPVQWDRTSSILRTTRSTAISVIDLLVLNVSTQFSIWP